MFNVGNKKNISGFLSNLISDEILKINGVNEIKDIKGKYDFEKKEVILDIYLVLDYKCKIPDVSWEVQNLSKKIITTIDDIILKEVNIHIVGIKEKRG